MSATNDKDSGTAFAGKTEPKLSLSDDTDAFVEAWTDNYFLKTRNIVSKFGDMPVTYAIFMRRPVLFTPRLMVQWLDQMAKKRSTKFTIKLNYNEGEWVGAGEPLVYISGSFMHLVDLETIYLQKLGAACVAAYNVYAMCVDLPKTAFLAMDCRHCAGSEMAEMMAYAASVGSEAAQRQVNAIGFIGNATNATAHYFGQNAGKGTMPHALIGYARSTLRAAEMYSEIYPDGPLTVLVDYFGQEITDALAVCRRFHDKAVNGQISVRLDTHGGRFIEGLDPQKSYAVLERNVPNAIRRYRNETELRFLTGTGVSAAAIYHMREKLDDAGYTSVKIVASSGFGVQKCKIMADINAPIDVIGTGSFLPEHWSETYATADIVTYDNRASIKVGREFLLQK